MATIDKPPATQEELDAEEVLRLVSEGKKVTDPELRRRITERADEVRRQIKSGTTDMAAELTDPDDE